MEGKGALAILAGSSELVSAEGNVLKIKCSNKAAHSQVADNADLLERIASEIAGENLQILCESQTSPKEENIAKVIGDRLSIDIELE